LSKIKPSPKEGLISDNAGPHFCGSSFDEKNKRVVALESGGDDRNRTCDPLNANQVLSQLSYIPKKLVAGTGFEPATFGL
jgi:hypothetical protein